MKSIVALLKQLEKEDLKVAKLCTEFSAYLKTVKDDAYKLNKIKSALPRGNVGHLIDVEISWLLSELDEK